MSKNPIVLLKKPNLKQKLYIRTYLLIAFYVEDFKERLIAAFKKLRTALAQETDETKKMLEIYMRQSQGQATKAEMAWANKQFRSVLKSLGLGVFLILPFSPVTLPLLVRLGRRLGVEVLPDSFKDQSQSRR